MNRFITKPKQLCKWKHLNNWKRINYSTAHNGHMYNVINDTKTELTNVTNHLRFHQHELRNKAFDQFRILLRNEVSNFNGPICAIIINLYEIECWFNLTNKSRDEVRGWIEELSCDDYDVKMMTDDEDNVVFYCDM